MTAHFHLGHRESRGINVEMDLKVCTRWRDSKSFTFGHRTNENETFSLYVIVIFFDIVVVLRFSNESCLAIYVNLLSGVNRPQK